MGSYINKGNWGFIKYTNGEYVDKTEMIAFVNSTLETSDMLTCVTRPRRFGKSMAANMLCAYYDKSCDSLELFSKFKIANESSFKEHLNKYPVIYLDVTNFVTDYRGRKDIVKKIQKALKDDLLSIYTEVEVPQNANLMATLLAITNKTKEKSDLVFIPRRNTNRPALVIELKWDKSSLAAIEQIKNQDYHEPLKDFTGEILLIGINYDKEKKSHSCKIEKVLK